MSYLTDDEKEKLENCAQSSSTPQLWSPDGGEAVTITDIVQNKGMAKGKDGKLFKPKKWTPVSLSQKITDPNFGKINHADSQCSCEGIGCEKCKEDE